MSLIETTARAAYENQKLKSEPPWEDIGHNRLVWMETVTPLVDAVVAAIRTEIEALYTVVLPVTVDGSAPTPAYVVLLADVLAVLDGGPDA